MGAVEGTARELSVDATELISAVCSRLGGDIDPVMDELQSVVFAAVGPPFQTEPSLAAGVVASTRSNVLHWTSSVERAPTVAVGVNLSAEVVGAGRDAFRLGLENELMAAYHTAHHALWRRWMGLAFVMSTDLSVLEEAFDAAARSMSDFTDRMLAALGEQLESERAALTRGSHAQKFETVSLILEGAPISPERAGERLGYSLQGAHRAAVLWTDPRRPDRQAMEQAAEALARATGSSRSLHVIASSSSLWTWLANPAPVTGADLSVALLREAHVRVALGTEESGVDGFRRSHLDAIATQRLVAPNVDVHLAEFADVQLAALAGSSEHLAREYVARVLGELASADPELRRTVHTYIREHFSASRTARALFAHRNTVINRIQRAEQLLPSSLEERGLEVGVALELALWLGTPPPVRSASAR